MSTLIAVVAMTLAACSGASNDDEDAPLVVVTTGHIHDAALAITAGAKVDLKLLCGPGVDPHSFSASTKDVLAMERAALIAFNGFHLEAQLGDLLDRDAFAGKSFCMADHFPEQSRLDWEEDGEVDPDAPFDPHIWNDLDGWAHCVTALAAHMGTVFPEHAELFASNGATYVQEIRDADAWATQVLASLPEERRILVSGHDAFNYFAKRYGLETIAVLGVGNDPEADLRTMRDVAEKVAARRVPVIFLESITNPRLTRALREACQKKGWDVRIADEPLYSDDLGETAPVDTFLGAFRANVETIAMGLKV